MRFNFSRNKLNLEEKFLQRLFELIPAALSWGVIILFTVFSIYKPFIAAGFIIAFYIYWILKVLYLNINLRSAYKRLAIEEEVADWITRARGLNDVSDYIRHLYLTDLIEPNTAEDKSMNIHKAEIVALRKTKKVPMLLKDIHHCVVIPIDTFRQNPLHSALESIKLNTFHPDKIMVILAFDQNLTANEQESLENIQVSFKNDFFKILLLKYDQTEAGVISAKAAVANKAVRGAAKYFKAEEVSFKNVIVTVFDKPRAVSHDFFSCLTYTYMVTPERLEVTFQPIASYSEAILKESSIFSAFEISSSCFEVAGLVSPNRLVSFLPNSMSMQFLIEMDYLPVDLQSFNEAFSYKAFIRKGLTYRVVPFFCRYIIDRTAKDSGRSSLKGFGTQKSSTAWGVEIFPILMRAFIKTKNIPTLEKLKKAFSLLENYLALATWPFLLTIIGWMPIFFLGRDFSHPTFYFNVPRIRGMIFLLAFLGFVNVFALGLSLLPKTKRKEEVTDKIKRIPQFIAASTFTFFISAFYSLLIQTRIALGVYYTNIRKK